jgi:hypothetical protein
VVEAVGEKKVLTDGTHVIELYHLQNFGHHDGRRIVYFPKEKVEHGPACRDALWRPGTTLQRLKAHAANFSKYK